MQMEGKEEKQLQEESEGSREKRGSSTGKDQKGQMNDGKMMREMRGKNRVGVGRTFKVRNTDQFSEPKSPHFH